MREPDLTVGPTLFTDARVLAVAEEHPLADRGSAPLELLADFRHGWADLKLDYWEDSYLPFETRRGRAIERVGLAVHADDLITAVGTGEIVMAFPGHVTRHRGMPDIRFLPVTDLPPLRFALVWRTEAENDLIRSLAATVRDLGPLEP